MSDTPYQWGGEHFCEPDLTSLYYREINRIWDPAIGHPVKLEELPDPETFCSTCLLWFTDPAKLGGLGLQPPEEGTAHE